LTSNANRTVNDALLEAELYDSLDVRNPQSQPQPQQQRQTIPLSAPNINSNSSNYSQPVHSLPPRTSNMNSTDIFMPSSYDGGPGSFLSHFGPDDQLFQQPLLNNIDQNYVSNPRTGPSTQQKPPPRSQYEPRNAAFDDPYGNPSGPTQRSNYGAPQRPPNNENPYASKPIGQGSRSDPYDNMDPFSEYHDMYEPTSQPRIPPIPPQQQRPPASQQTYQRYPAGQQQQQQQQSFDSQKPPSNRELFFTDNYDEETLPISSYRKPVEFSTSSGAPGPISHRSGEHEQDTRRQAVWNELQRNNAKVQEKNAKKRESANRREQRLKGNYAAPWNPNGFQQSSAPAKTTGNPPAPRPPPVPKTNYIEDNIDMIRNKENFYHRYPAKKYENLYSKRKDLAGEGKPNEKKDSRGGNGGESPDDNNQTQSAHFAMDNNNNEDSKHRSSLPVTINLNPGETSQKGVLPATVTIPLDSHVNRVGDKISVNIDLRLVDLQNLQKQQQQQQNAEGPDWSSLDPLDRHIRKLERSIDQTLPPTHSPTNRSPTLSNPSLHPSIGRYGKMTTGATQGGYAPPTYSGDHYSYGDKGREEDSYLAKMNHLKRGPAFKPYTGKDYEQFKKNYGFGGGNLGFDFDNPTYKEKSDKLSKTKEYAQQVEARNKQKLAEAPRRTLSDTRIPNESSKTQRALDYARVSTRHKQSSDASNRSSPPNMNDNVAPTAAPRRPTEVLHRPPPVIKSQTKSTANNNNDLVERLAARHEQDKAQVQGILNPSQKRREPMFQDERGASDIERLAQDRANQRRISPARPMPPPTNANNTNGRRPLRFDTNVPDDSNYPSGPYQERTQQRPMPSYQPAPPIAQHSVQQSPQRREPEREREPIREPPREREPIREPPRERERERVREPQRTPQRHQQNSAHDEANLDQLANRHNDEKMLMEAIRQELSENPLGDDEELIVVEQ